MLVEFEMKDCKCISTLTQLGFKPVQNPEEKIFDVILYKRFVLLLISLLFIVILEFNRSKID